jgi:methanobactin biosynthesis MbnP-like protein
MKSFIYSSALALLIFTSCKKENKSEIQPGDTGAIEIEFDNIAGDQDLELNTGTYTNRSGETFTVSTLNYYISNIKLRTSNGVEYVVPKDESYFLIKEDDEESQTIELENLPAGDYTSFTFTVGVDSIKSIAPVSERTGVLDPAGEANEMYWNMNTGYIFMKMEGTSPASTTQNKQFFYHIGGFGGYDSPTFNNIKTVTVNAPSGMSAKVRKDRATPPEVHFFTDVTKILDGTNQISIAANSTVEFSEVSTKIADNYANMFNIDHIHND